MVQVGDGDLLDLKNVVRIENRLEVLSRQECRLELVQAIVMGVALGEVLLLDRLQHLENSLLRVGRLLIQNVRHELLQDKCIAMLASSHCH